MHNDVFTLNKKRNDDLKKVNEFTGKALESYIKGIEFVDKQFEIDDLQLRTKVGFAVAEYLLARISNQQNK